MANDEEHLEGNTPSISIRGPPGRPYKMTIELPLFLCILGLSLSGSALNNIIFFRTCSHLLNHTEEECKGFLSPIRSNSTKLLENDVQGYATFVLTVKTVMESIGPAIMSLFLGVWSDTYGRKPLIVWPMLGLALSSMLIVVYGLIDLNPWWYILTVIPFSFTGGFVVMFTGAYCYVSDIATTESTTLRMVFIDATISLGNVLGSLVSSYLILLIGNVNLLLVTASLHVLAYAFTNVYVRESLVGALEGGFCKILDWLHVREMVHECFKERPNHGRVQILLLIFVRCISVFLLFGTLGLEYLYSRTKLNWALDDYNTFSAVSTAILFVGSFFGIMVVQKLLRISDLTFAIMSMCMSGTEFFLKAFAVTSWQMYLSVSVSFFKDLSGSLIRSFVTKSFPVEDIAKIFALMCALEGLCPIVAPIVYNTIYGLTLTTFPGTFYLMSSGLIAVNVVLLGFVKYYSWNAPTVPYRSLADEEI
ncbi:PREDICTED: proton-coupled folate transporter-like [Papilio polytes]|uniref:proton-coupled folate transporter-like n=1 Tax=Papilio polytes TaxID=76194 RepID=UPI0006768490|nr:PREDICTED: proton-coupled folate transporter-like [Papilio polytes]